MYCRSSFCPNHFLWNQKQKQVCASHIWMYDNLRHLWPKCDQSCYAKKTTKNTERVTGVTDSKLWQIVTVTNVTNGLTLSVTGTKPVSVSVWNPGRNGSKACHMYEWVMSQISMRHVTDMNESWHVWMSHVTDMNESWVTYEREMSQIWMSHVTHMNESYHRYEWVMSHKWMTHVKHINESCHTYEIQVRHRTQGAVNK